MPIPKTRLLLRLETRNPLLTNELRRRKKIVKIETFSIIKINSQKTCIISPHVCYFAAGAGCFFFVPSVVLLKR